MTNNKFFQCGLLWISLITYCLSAAPDTWNKNHEIREKLLKNYDKTALPQKNVNGTTTVFVNMILRGIWIDDNQQILVVNSWLAMFWVDERLKWDYKDHGNLKLVHFGDGELWKPDVHLYNNAKISEVNHYGNVNFLVYNEGNVIWVPPAHFEVNCPIDLKFWPFDTHICEVIIGSWTTNGWQVNFEVRNTTEMTHMWLTTESNNWVLLKASQERKVTMFEGYDEPYIDITYTFHLKRSSPTFEATVIVPAIAIPIFMMLQFVLPVDHPQRLSIGCSCTLLVLLELLFLKFSLPKLGTSVPLIISYYSQSFILVVLTVAISAGLGRLAHPQNPLVAYPPPEYLKRFLTWIPATVLCLRNHANKVTWSNGGKTEDGEVLDSSKEVTYAHEWLFVAKAVDRIAIILFLALYIFSLIGYLSPIK